MGSHPVFCSGMSDRPVPHRGLCEDPLALPVGLDYRDFHVRIVRDGNRQFRCFDNKGSPLVEFCGDGKPVLFGIVPDAYLHAVFRVCPRYDPLTINPEGFSIGIPGFPPLVLGKDA